MRKEQKVNIESIKGTIFVLLSAIGFSIGGLLIKLVPWSALTIQCVRCLFSTMTVIIYMAATKHKFVFNKSVVLGALLNFVMALTFVMATKMTTAANAVVLQFTEPVFVILLIWIFYKKKPEKQALIACFFVLAGIVCFFYDSLGGGVMMGNILAIISGLFYAGFFLVKKFPNGDFESSLLISNAISVVIGAPAVTFESDFSLSIIAVVIVLGVVQSGISYIFLSKGLDRISPVTASLTSTIEPILNPTLVAIFYGESIGLISMAGAVLVVGSAAIYNVWESQRHKNPMHKAQMRSKYT